MIINHNMNALNAHRNMTSNTVNSGKSMEKLSSGLRINRAGDDAAGLAISEKMRGQIRGLDQAQRNSQDGISMIQTAEGALNETHSILQRMRELSVQAGNDTNTGKDREEIQKEINQLTSEINRIGNTTEFNNQKLLNATSGTVTAAKVAVAGVTEAATVGTSDVVVDGVTLTYNVTGGGVTNFKNADELAQLINSNDKLSAKYTASAAGTKLTLTQKAGFESATAPTITGAGVVSTTKAGVAAADFKSSLSLQVGANENQTMTVDFSDMRSAALGLTGTGDGYSDTANVTNGTDNKNVENALDVTTAANAGKAVTKIQTAIDKVSAERSKLGAFQNRLEHTINNLGTSSENLTAAESRVRDVDMAKEMMNFSKNNILSQAAQAMLAQANQQPQGVLQLLR
ncbi:flagellin [Clostridium tertium]|uniref:flagellin N-terminal helical domain-containing protein n=1 Tax=Clostridium tertium TaxID=1559 RepID=UPI000BE30AE0|nr:flagellin [Clostridium tertium]